MEDGTIREVLMKDQVRKCYKSGMHRWLAVFRNNDSLNKAYLSSLTDSSVYLLSCLYETRMQHKQATRFSIVQISSSVLLMPVANTDLITDSFVMILNSCGSKVNSTHENSSLSPPAMYGAWSTVD